MKRLLLLLLTVCTLTTAFAAPPREQVSADAKWMLHLDFGQLRATKVGGFFVNMVQKEMKSGFEEIRKELQFSADVEKLLTQVESVTIYGTDYKSDAHNSVALLRVAPELHQIAVGTLAGIVLADTNSSVKVENTKQGDIFYYNIKSQFHCAVLPGNIILAGKSRELTEKAVQVLNRKAPNLTPTKTFSGFAEAKQTFFFLAIAEGFSTEANLPPDARLLQLADGGQIVLGEAGDKFFLNLALRAKTAEIVMQMQQVVQGLIALGSLGRAEHKDLAHLLKSVKVSTNDKVVSVSLEYPATDLVKRLSDATGDGKILAKKPEEAK